MLRRYLFAIGWTLLILAGCSIPGQDLPDIQFDLFEEDKLIHFTFFAVYGWLWSQALPKTLPSKFAWVGISGIVYGVGTELYQGMLPWERTPDPMDAIANILGLLVAITVFGFRDKAS